MIQISEMELFDYIRCPLKYQAQYKIGMALPDNISFMKLLGQVASSFELSLMNDTIMHPSHIKRKWDVLCEKHKDIITGKKSLEGISLLMKFYNWARDYKLRIADLKVPFNYVSVLDGEENISVRGEIAGAISILDTGHAEILIIDFNHSVTSPAMVDMKLKYTLDYVAAKKLLGKDVELDGIHVHHVNMNQDVFSVRGEEELKRLDITIHNVTKCIYNNLYYPRETAFCISCFMKNYCRAWRG